MHLNVDDWINVNFSFFTIEDHQVKPWKVFKWRSINYSLQWMSELPLVIKTNKQQQQQQVKSKRIERQKIVVTYESSIDSINIW